MHGEQFDDLLDDPALRGRGVLTGLLEPAELLPDVLVVGLQQHDGIGGHQLSPFACLNHVGGFRGSGPGISVMRFEPTIDLPLTGFPAAHHSDADQVPDPQDAAQCSASSELSP